MALPVQGTEDFLKVFSVDTHTHTCLSPCSGLEMHPAALARAAADAGLGAVAVCDHNSAENVGAAVRAGARCGVVVLPGMEVTTEEEVHIVALLPDVGAAQVLQSKVYRNLPGQNDPELFGMQVVANEDEEVLGFNEHLLSGATTLSVEAVVAAIHDAGGMAVAAHADRERFGLLGQLGMIPEGLRLDGLEISAQTPLSAARERFAPNGEFPLLCASDAHEPKDVGRAVTYMLLEAANPGEVRKALAEAGGRAVLGGGRPMEELALHILDIAQNGAEAGASRIEISLVEDPIRDVLVIEVKDNGRGMDAETAARALDPFFTTRTTRKVGMGLPLLAAATRAAGGTLDLDTALGRGTRLKATFQYGHVDRAPVGDLETTLLVLFAGHPDLEVRFRHGVGGSEYELDSGDMRAALEGAALSSPEGLAFCREVIRRGEKSLKETKDVGGGRP